MKLSKLGLLAIIFGYIILAAIIVLLAVGSRSSRQDYTTALLETEAVAQTTEQTEPTPAETTTTAETTPETTTEPETTTTEETEPPEPEDTTPPVIEGVSDLSVHVGETISYKSHVTVTDDIDPEPALSVDVSGVDLQNVGSYYVIYVAEDASGNQSYAAASVSVVPQASVTTEEAEKVAQEILDEILYDEMTDVEKVIEIFFYLHNIGYTDRHYGDATNYLDNGYYFLTTRIGDCRCFYAASKLLLEQAGFMTQMVQSSGSSMVTHYWNLVSIDDGETWYHFDPTDWAWKDDNQYICMVSDQWLWDYATEHNYEPLTWDADHYPATPEESLIVF